MLKLLQSVRPNPFYAPGGVDNFWKVERDDHDSKAASTEEFAVLRNEKEDDLSIDARKEEGMKGLERAEVEKGVASCWEEGHRHLSASFQEDLEGIVLSTAAVNLHQTSLINICRFNQNIS